MQSGRRRVPDRIHFESSVTPVECPSPAPMLARLPLSRDPDGIPVKRFLPELVVRRCFQASTTGHLDMPTGSRAGRPGEPGSRSPQAHVGRYLAHTQAVPLRYWCDTSVIPGCAEDGFSKDSEVHCEPVEVLSMGSRGWLKCTLGTPQSSFEARALHLARVMMRRSTWSEWSRWIAAFGFVVERAAVIYS